MENTTPAFFIGHGSPMNLIQENPFTIDMKNLGKNLRKPKCIAVISAHWLAKESYITADEQPKIIYDYYGFPEELYKIKYNASGSPKFADLIAEKLPLEKNALSLKWGLDHACFSVLKFIFPDENVPVVEISIDISKPPEYHYELGQKLRSLREKGIMFIGSGNLIHTFKYVKNNWNSEPFPWVIEFDKILKNSLINGDIKSLINYTNWELSKKAFQTNDHYLPMLYILGMQGKDENLKFIHNSIQHGSISHRCFQIG